MITKVCQFQARPGERLVEVFTPGEMEKAASFFNMGKTAAPLLPPVQAYLEKLQADPNKIYVLVNALGAGEFWGSNINGDYFPEAALIHKGMDWGYETFYNAYPYKHHVNKDPSRSFGKVELAVWHDGMKRVELVISIDRARAKMFGAEDVCDKLDQGMFPDVSMGCKVPYDLCSYCLDWDKYRRAQSSYDPRIHRTVGQAVLAFHRRDPIRGLSVTRNDYCEHLSTMLNKIMPDGRKVYAINDYPRFFDISFVFIGADKTAKVMAKLAEANNCFNGVCVPSWAVAEKRYQTAPTEKGFEKVAAYSQAGHGLTKLEDLLADLGVAKGTARGIGDTVSSPIETIRSKLREKKASHSKWAEIIKNVAPSQFGGKAIRVDKHGPDLPDGVLDRLGEHRNLSEALSTPTSMGIVLRPREFQRITLISIGRKPMADSLDQAGAVFRPCNEEDSSVPMGHGHFSSILKKLLLPMMEDRSLLEPVAKRRIIKITMRPHSVHHHKGPVMKLASHDPVLTKISAAYNSYLDRIGECMGHAETVVNEHPDVWEAAFRSGVGDGFSKEAAGMRPGSTPVVLGSVAGAALLSSYADYQRQRAMQGDRKPVGALTSLAADNPRTLMLLAGLGAMHLRGSNVPRRMISTAAGAIKGFMGVKPR